MSAGSVAVVPGVNQRKWFTPSGLAESNENRATELPLMLFDEFEDKKSAVVPLVIR